MNNLATTEADIVSMAMRLSGVGAQVGLTEAEIMALSGTMASVGINAEAGGSAMSTVMKKIQNAVAEGGEAVEGFAIAANMSSADFVKAWENDPITALDAFIKGLADSGESGENLNAILADLGIKGIQETDTLLRLAGASELLGEAVDISTDAWKENSALSEEAAQRYETFESKVAMLKNTLTDIAISIGNVLLPVITSMVEFVQSLADKFSNLDEKAMVIIAVVASLAAGFLLLAGPILMLIGYIPSMLAGFTALSTVFAALTGPIGLTVAAIMAVIAALVLAYTQFEWFRDVVDAIWQAIWGVIQTVVSAIGEFINDMITSVRGFWEENSEAIKATTEVIWNAIKAMFESVLPVIQALFEHTWNTIKATVEAVWTIIETIIGTALDVIMGIIQVFIGVFTGDWDKAWKGIEKITSSITNAIKTIISTVFNAIKSIITSILNTIRTIVSTVWNGIKSNINTVMNAIKTLISVAWTTIKTTVSTAVNSIRDTISTIFGALKGIVSNKFSDVTSAVATGMSDALKKVTDKVKEFYTAGANIVKSIADGITGSIKFVTDAIGKVAEKIRNFLPFSPAKEGALRDIMDIQVGQSIAKAIDKGKATAVRSMSNLTDALGGELPTFDMAGQVNSINRQANRQIQSHLTSELNVNKQPAQINVYVGSNQIASEIVDDISRLQGDNHNVRRSSYGF